MHFEDIIDQSTQIKHIYKEWIFKVTDSSGNGHFDDLSNILPSGAALISMSTRFLWPYDSWDYHKCYISVKREDRNQLWIISDRVQTYFIGIDFLYI